MSAPSSHLDYPTNEASHVSTPAPQSKRRKVKVQSEAGKIATPLRQQNDGKVIIQRTGANQTGRPTEQRKRRRAIAQRPENEQAPPTPQQQSPREVAVQGETGEVSETVVGILCKTCKDIFAHAKDRARKFSWYYDIIGLIDSAEKGCHFCVQVLRKIDSADVESLKREFAELDVAQPKSAEKRLKAETSYYEHMGVAFILRRKDAGTRECLAQLSLYFTQGISK